MRNINNLKSIDVVCKTYLVPVPIWINPLTFNFMVRGCANDDLHNVLYVIDQLLQFVPDESQGQCQQKKLDNEYEFVI